MGGQDPQRENSRNCSTDPDEQYFIDELQAHLLEEANGASKFKECLSNSESHLTSIKSSYLANSNNLVGGAISVRDDLSCRRRKTSH